MWSKQPAVYIRSVQAMNLPQILSSCCDPLEACRWPEPPALKLLLASGAKGMVPKALPWPCTACGGRKPRSA